MTRHVTYHKKLRMLHRIELTFIVHTIKRDDLFQKRSKFRIGSWIDGYLEQGSENIIDHLSKIMNHVCFFPHLIETRNLNHPSNVVRGKIVIVVPLPEFVKFVRTSSVDRNSRFGVRVLVRFEILKHLFRNLSNISSLHVIVVFQENITQSGLSDRIVLSVETIESSKRGVSVHVQRVNREVVTVRLFVYCVFFLYESTESVNTRDVRSEIETLKELRQRNCSFLRNNI